MLEEGKAEDAPIRAGAPVCREPGKPAELGEDEPYPCDEPCGMCKFAPKPVVAYFGLDPSCAKGSAILSNSLVQRELTIMQNGCLANERQRGACGSCGFRRFRRVKGLRLRMSLRRATKISRDWLMFGEYLRELFKSLSAE